MATQLTPRSPIGTHRGAGSTANPGGSTTERRGGCHRALIMDWRGSERSDRLAPGFLVAGLAGAVGLGEAHDAGPVDQEGAAVGEAALLVEHAVLLGHGAVRPEV